MEEGTGYMLTPNKSLPSREGPAANEELEEDSISEYNGIFGFPIISLVVLILLDSQISLVALLFETVLLTLLLITLLFRWDGPPSEQFSCFR